MKKTAFILAIAAITLTLGTQNASAKGAQKKAETEKVDSAQAATEAAGIMTQTQLEAYQLRLQYEKEKSELEHRQYMDKTELHHKHEMEYEYCYSRRNQIRAIGELAIHIAGIVLIFLIPILLSIIYLRKEKEQVREKEALIDLVRSGTQITPEIVDLLGRKPSPNEPMATIGKKLKMPQDDMKYCIKRTAWACISLVVGFAFACMTNEGIFFGAGALIAIILVIQGGTRYAISRSQNRTNNGEDNAQ